MTSCHSDVCGSFLQNILQNMELDWFVDVTAAATCDDRIRSINQLAAKQLQIVSLQHAHSLHC